MVLNESANITDHDYSSALFSWAGIWQRVSGPDLHPSSENGTIPFTSAALLSLAYVRTHLDIGPHLQLSTRDPTVVASSLFLVAPPRRNTNLTRALLYAVHALSLPVAFGLEYMARTQSIIWCCQHAIYALESAVFLSKWLENINTTQILGAMESESLLNRNRQSAS